MKIRVEELKGIRKKYGSMIWDSYPVVYVLEAKVEWFDNWHQKMPEKNYDVRANKETIPHRAIRYRVDFPKGVRDYIPTSNDCCSKSGKHG